MPQRTLTLLRAGKELSDPATQRKVLWSSLDERAGALPTFEAKIAAAGTPALVSKQIEILQINVGKLCNQTCRHCHVDAGPERREIMSREIAEACLKLLAESLIETLDITGGAPELNPNFRWMVSEARRLDRQSLTAVI